MEKKKWLRVEIIKDTGKTKVYELYNIETSELVGIVKWYSGFRKYVFYPESNMLFSESCLSQIVDFINNLMKERNVKIT